MNTNEDIWMPLPATLAQNTKVVLYDTTADPGTGVTAKRSGYGSRFRRILFAITADRSSATNGYTYEESSDGGVTWIVVFQETQATGTDWSREHLRNRKDFRLTWKEGNAGVATVTSGGITLVRGDRAAGT